MGIFALTKFVALSELYTDHRLRDTVLLIDGPNLWKRLHSRYVKQWRRDHLFGGDYGYFAEYVHQFFDTLQDCDIRPVVIMDGASLQESFHSVKKIQRLQARLEEAIEICKKVSFVFILKCLYIFFKINSN